MTAEELMNELESRPWTRENRLRIMREVIAAVIAAERERCIAVAKKAIQHHYGYSGEIVATAMRSNIEEKV